MDAPDRLAPPLPSRLGLPLGLQRLPEEHHSAAGTGTGTKRPDGKGKGTEQQGASGVAACCRALYPDPAEEEPAVGHA